MRIRLLLVILLSMSLPLSCKKKQPEAPSAASQPTLQGKPDKVSEEPTGLPGYPLLCRWTQGPASDTLEASLNCFLGDDKGQPAQLSAKTSWEASVSGDATLLQQMLPNQSLNLSVKGKTRDGLTLAIQNMQLKASYQSVQRSSSGRDVVKADAKKLRLAASCKNLFTLLFVNDAATFTYLELNSFTGCETLATSLMNAVVPDGKSRLLPDLHKTVQASCKDGLFSLSINQPTFQGSSSQGPLDADSCEDLRGLVNNLGL
ncbi:MAG TPA: hypothetical protein VFO10_00815 [Oligoflexus sp.]|uniref:hypothetical protein n=1 Tax=Oligoflexus sp. TaxID=1971216 RepID=UPI002D80A440|nr:hypothetical protein [Oligoflexus sp.]HET9235756.1 hypothetical protein [Oligoflexus sp.]